MYKENDFSRLELRLGACRDNYRYFRSLLEPSTRLLVLVKANAYGHGAVEFAAMMQKEGADYLAVAYPVEGIELRKSGISLPILVLTAGTDYFNEMIDYRLEPGIPNLHALKAFCEVLDSRGITGYPVHVKLDTGMHRLGFMTDEIQALTDFVKQCRSVRVKSLYSHLAAAEDPASDDFTLGQIRMFEDNASRIIGEIGYRPMLHILNSAGIERFPQFQHDMVRLGIGIYGISALPGVKLSPVASLKCKILQIKHLKPEDGTIGYGRHGDDTFTVFTLDRRRRHTLYYLTDVTQADALPLVVEDQNVLNVFNGLTELRCVTYLDVILLAILSILRGGRTVDSVAQI